MYAIRLELKTNWRFIFNNKCFSFSLKEQTSFRTEITVSQIHIYTLKAIIQKVILYYISKDNQSPARSAFFIATGQILSVEGIIMEEISETGTTENSSVSKQAARNRKVIKYRKRTYLFSSSQP